MPNSEVALYAEFTSLEGHIDHVRTLIRAYGRRVELEEGNLEFRIFTQRDAPKSFFVYETYRDDAAFQAHISTEYGRIFNEELAPLVIGGASRVTLLDEVPTT